MFKANNKHCKGYPRKHKDITETNKQNNFKNVEQEHVNDVPQWHKKLRIFAQSKTIEPFLFPSQLLPTFMLQRPPQ